MTKLKNTKLALNDWNHKFISNLQHKIYSTHTYIETLQAQPSSTLTLNREQKAQAELDELLLREHILWCEKAKTHWLEEGDTNICFLHLSTLVHKKYNCIHFILDCVNRKIEKYKCIADKFIDYYSNLFSTMHPTFLMIFRVSSTNNW